MEVITKGLSLKMSEQEIHDDLVKLGYITNKIDSAKMSKLGK